MAHDAYAAIARWYDPATAAILSGARARMVDTCLRRHCSRVLDIGCGTGRLLADLHKNGMRAVGVDSSPAMLAVAARSLPAHSALVLGGPSLPFASRSFDAAILSLVLHETDGEPEGLLAEALRVAPVCFALEWRMPERNLDLPMQAVVHAIERLAGKRHYARFRSFASRGYLHGTAMRAGARVLYEERLMGGTMVLAEVSL